VIESKDVDYIFCFAAKDSRATRSLLFATASTLVDPKHSELPHGISCSRYSFNAFGESLNDSQTDPFGYKAQFGYYTDNETGLQLLTHRYYDPSRGRFLTRDPISYDGGINVYAYGRSNPANIIDPSGLDILVIEQGPTEGNPIGHTALAITGRGVFSFGNGDKLATDNKRNILGGNVSEYLARETKRRDTRLYIIKTTPAQDAAIERKLREIAANERALAQDWHLAFDNCSTRSNRALDAGGIPGSLWFDMMGGGGSWTPDSNFPGTSGYRASQTNGLTDGVLIPKGAGWQPRIVGQFMPK
jgi:RHS repeat-associated protein